MTTEPKYFSAFGLRFLSVSCSQAAEYIVHSCADGKKKLVATANVDHLIQLQKNSDFQRAYARSEIIVADGMPLVWFSRIIAGKDGLPERVNGTELVNKLIAIAETTDIRIGLVGGEEGSAKDIAENLFARSSKNIICGFVSPNFGFEKDPSTNLQVIETVNQWKTDILLVGLGAPKQELWISNNWDALDFKVAIGVGSTIDILAGRRMRAPTWMQNAGLEWLWRLIQEPNRLWRRYLINDMAFIKLAWNEWKKKKNS